MTKKYEFDPALKAQWVAALRSGHYEQGACSLKKIQAGVTVHCCLGVLCEVLVQNGSDLVERVTIDDGDGDIAYREVFFRQKDFSGDLILNTTDLTDVTRHELGMKAKIMETLMGMNDSGKHDFESIADYIEKKL